MSDSQTYIAFKEKVIERSPIRTEVSLNDLDILDEGRICVRGLEAPITRQAFEDLIDLIGMPQRLLRLFRTRMGSHVTVNFLNAIRQALTSNDLKVQLIADGKRREIVRVLRSKVALVSYPLFFELFERSLQEQPGMEVRSLYFHPQTGVSIATAHPKWEFGLPGLSDEVFRSGLSFSNRLDEGLSLQPFNERLICSNGMVVREKTGAHRLKNLNPAELERFLINTLRPQTLRRYEKQFSEQVGRMAHVQASFAELQEAHDQFAKHAEGEQAQRFLQSYFPTGEIKADYKHKGYDLTQMGRMQCRNARTPLKVWDLVNNITFLATHKNIELPLTSSARHEMQVFAGALAFKKTFDTECLIPDIYENSRKIN